MVRLLQVWCGRRGPSCRANRRGVVCACSSGASRWLAVGVDETALGGVDERVRAHGALRVRAWCGRGDPVRRLRLHGCVWSWSWRAPAQGEVRPWGSVAEPAPAWSRALVLIMIPGPVSASAVGIVQAACACADVRGGGHGALPFVVCVPRDAARREGVPASSSTGKTLQTHGLGRLWDVRRCGGPGGEWAGRRIRDDGRDRSNAPRSMSAMAAVPPPASERDFLRERPAEADATQRFGATEGPPRLVRKLGWVHETQPVRAVGGSFGRRQASVNAAIAARASLRKSRERDFLRERPAEADATQRFGATEGPPRLVRKPGWVHETQPVRAVGEVLRSAPRRR
jgi:hypothetical protein